MALATTYSIEILLEGVESLAHKRSPHFLGGIQHFVDFLLPAHITGLAVAMLLYANDQLFPIIFASAVAIASKAIFQTAIGKGSRHFFNPSNFGITITLLLFPWVGIAPPYQFTENLSGMGDWLLPGLIVISGTFLNGRFTRRLPLIAAWLIGFLIQAFLRSFIFSTPLVAALVPMTGVAFILFTFYMVTDPGTTPIRPREQVLFGAGVAATYGILMISHIVFGLFFALTIVCAVRGILLQVQTMVTLEEPANVIPASATALEV
ncbi:MAG: enediyne biosynthesis protein UnbU [Heteroscytonema crispum UTEX LB 1556]